MTVPSCAEHNNVKSNDDQYVLAHISIHAALGDNLPQQIFCRSIQPQLERSPAFTAALLEGGVVLPDHSRKYRIDISRFDNFYDHLTCALYFNRYSEPLDKRRHEMSHVYLSLHTDDREEQEAKRLLVMAFGHLLAGFHSNVSNYESDHSGEVIYQSAIMDPFGSKGSITMIHTFYGVFDTVSLLTLRIPEP